MRIRTSIKRVCTHCKIISRNKRLVNCCKFNNHKSKQK